MSHQCRNRFLLLVLLLPIVAATSVKAVRAEAEKGQASVSQTDDISIVLQPLDLRLIGTAVAGDPDQSLAVVVDLKTGSIQSYHEGDGIGNFVVGKIERAAVILKSGGGGTKLTMTGSGRSTQQGADASQKAVGSVSEEEIARAVPNYMDMVRTIRIRPYLEAGRPWGVLVYNIDPQSVFAKMGLADGDIIKAVNGEELKTPRDTIEFYDAIREGGTVTLAVKRGEDTQELKFDIH